MTGKQLFFRTYFGIGLVYAVYEWLFGDYSYKSFAYNLGRGLIWPAVMFPAIGAAIGAILLFGIVVGILIFVPSNN